MRCRTLIVMLAMFVVVSFTFSMALQAQEQNSPYFMGWDNMVKPSMVAEYDAAMVNEVEFFEKYNFPYKWNVYSTNDYHYYLVIDVDNYSEIDKIHAAIDDVAEEAGEEWSKMFGLFDGTYTSVDRFLLRRRPDISYVPETPRLTAEDAPFLYWGFCSIIPGKGSKVTENFKKFIEIAKKHNFTTGWNTFSGEFGKDMPNLVYTETGASAGDFFSAVEKEGEAANEEMEALWLDTMKYLRKYELKMGMFRPELSYTPDKK